jgi:hypothetical protein
MHTAFCANEIYISIIHRAPMNGAAGACACAAAAGVLRKKCVCIESCWRLIHSVGFVCAINLNARRRHSYISVNTAR